MTRTEGQFIISHVTGLMAEAARRVANLRIDFMASSSRLKRRAAQLPRDIVNAVRRRPRRR
jgi:hypothetical protein